MLHEVPRLLGQVLQLPGREVNVAQLRVGMGLQLRWLVAVVMHPHVLHRDVGDLLDACLELGGHAGEVHGALLQYYD